MTHPATESLYSYDHPLSNNFVYCSDLLNCLEPLLSALHWQGSKRNLVESLPHFADTLNLSDFHHVMGELNYDVACFKSRLDQLHPNVLPCLFIPTQGVACVVLECHNDYFTIVDGSTGNQRQLPKNSCLGHVYLYQQKKQPPIKKHHWFVQCLKQHQNVLLQFFSITFLLSLLTLAIPFFIMNVYNRVITTTSAQMLMEFSLALIITLTTIFILSLLRIRIQAYLCGKFDETIGNKIFSHLVHLPYHQLEKISIDEQIAQMKNIDPLRAFLTRPIIHCILEIACTPLLLLAIAILGGSLALIPLGIICLYIALGFCFQNMIKTSTINNTHHHVQQQKFLLEALKQQTHIHHNHAETVWHDRFKIISADTCIGHLRTNFISALLNNMADTLIVFASVLTIYFGALNVIDHTLSGGALIAIMLFMWQMLTPMKTLLAAFSTITQIKHNLTQLNPLMTLDTELHATHLHRDNELPGNDIQFEQVSYCYPHNAEPALTNIACSIPSNQLTIIFGSPGAGKTSFLKLLLQLQTPQAGNIKIGGKNINEIDTKELRHHIAYMPQTPEFFYGTIAQNLRLANPMAQEQDLIEACQLAGIYQQIIGLPESFNSRIGDQKNTHLPLSFQQKLSLARAFVKPTSILLLDEPSHGLDPADFKELMNRLNRLKQQKTIIMTTQYTTETHYADHLITLVQGNLVPSSNT
jgi:ATP-binding cassette, subfamily C, bacterial LapB